MRIAIATVQVPFIRGGAEVMTEQLLLALRERGYQTELVSMPFRHGPCAPVRRSMDVWETESFETFDCGAIERVICLKFPSYYLRHPHKTVWMLHQHRSVYELYNTPFGESDQSEEARALRKDIIDRDTRRLQDARAVFTISQQVSDRLAHFNGISSTPLLQPPAHADRFYCSQQLGYIFCPSRLETLKRQDLLIRAVALCRAPVAVIIAGEGSAKASLEQLIQELNVADRVRLIGRVEDDEMRTWYANALGVFFGPYEEDYGFITLEAMLSSKPVITCKDSAGPLSFVVHDETGWVVEPEPVEIANAIESMYAHVDRTGAMGQAGRERYMQLGISWDHIVSQLLGLPT